MQNVSRESGAAAAKGLEFLAVRGLKRLVPFGGEGFNVDIEKLEKQYVRTIRRMAGYPSCAHKEGQRDGRAGTVVPARASRDWMLLYADTYEPNQYDHYLYLGAGGKIVIPREIRDETGWAIGERLSIKDEGDHVILSTCCERNRCRSCGTNRNVIEVIDNLFLWRIVGIGICLKTARLLAREDKFARYNQ